MCSEEGITLMSSVQAETDAAGQTAAEGDVQGIKWLAGLTCNGTPLCLSKVISMLPFQQTVCLLCF